MTEKWFKLLLDFEKLPKTATLRTLFEITGYPHFENVSSNVLSFYLNPNYEHGLKDLVVKSLLQIISSDTVGEIYPDKVTIEREFPAGDNMRIDLLVQTEKYVIGIENKIFHWLHNDLAAYRKAIENKKNKDQNIHAVILSLHSLKDANDKMKMKLNKFINITYDDLFGKIRENIGGYLNNENTKFTAYLLDFIRTIENLKGAQMENEEAGKFFQENWEGIEGLIKQYNEYLQYIYKKVDIVRENISSEDFKKTYTEERIWQKSCLVYDYSIDNKAISIDTWVGIKGWVIELFGRDAASHGSTDYLHNVLCKEKTFLDITNSKPSTRNGIYIFQTEDINATDQVSKELLKLLQKIEKYKEINSNTSSECSG